MKKSENIYYPNYRNNNMSNMEQQKRNSYIRQKFVALFNCVARLENVS